jgi:CDP-glucose 4,6-dehydratase
MSKGDNVLMNCLITGANGFLGSALSERLCHQGHRVVGIVRDRNYKSRREILDRISVVHGDLRDPTVLRYALSQYEIDTIFHVGAVTILRKSVMDPLTCYETNVLGTAYLLEAARQQGIKKIVVASSDKAYGTYKKLPYKEEMHVQASADAYSTSKACTDLLAQQYAKGYDMDISIVRAGNIFGAGDLNMSRLIPRSILNCLDGIQPVLYKGVAQYKATPL